MTSELEGPTLQADRRTTYLRYLTAIGTIAAAALVAWGARTLVLVDALGVICVAVFAAAVLVTAWIAGVGPAIAATVLGALTLAFLFSGSEHILTPLPVRDNAIIIASTALSALITYVVARLHASRADLLRGLPAIERRARDRANDAAHARIEAERRITADAKADVADLQLALRQRDAAAKAAATARAGYLTATRQAVRLPLRALERYATRLSGFASDNLTPSQRHDLDEAVRCQEHMSSLLDKLLEPVRVEAAQFFPAVADVSLTDVVAEAYALVEPDLTARGCTLEYEAVTVPHVRGDAVILKQVLAWLLLDDARLGSRRVYSLNLVETDGGVAIECHATGNGSLTAEGLSGEPLDIALPGGLAAADLVRQMGGRLSTDAAPRTELRFTLWLSTRSASAADHPAGPVVLWPPIAFEFPLR